MQIRLIVHALRRHRLATLLITLQIALACAVLCNASFLIVRRIQRMQVRSGVDIAQLAEVSVQGFQASQANDVNARMLHGLRRLPGVESASAIDTVPFGQRAGTAGATTDAAGRHSIGTVDLYIGGPGTPQALGLHLVSGRLPHNDEYTHPKGILPEQAPVLITRSLARRLWPGQSALGKAFYVAKRRMQVIGVVTRLVRPDPAFGGPGTAQWSVFLPERAGGIISGTYLVRTAKGQVQNVLRRARTLVAKMSPEVVLDHDDTAAVSTLRRRYFATNRSMIALLAAVIIALMLVTALGIVGLASFWVAQRRKQIGVRRALGATRGDILRYFQTENFMIVSLGIVLGMVMAFGLNVLLMQHYALPRLPFAYAPVAALLLWLLGQLAVLAPALRASGVSPVTATRSV